MRVQQQRAARGRFVVMPLAEKFWPKVQVGGPAECWKWMGARTKNGYGYFHVDRRRRHGAHRIAYELMVGPISESLTIDHLCRNRSCVNPEHLEPIPLRENILRGSGFSARNAKKTHCKWGHRFDDINTYLDRNGWRMCKICRQRRKRKLYQRHRDITKSYPKRWQIARAEAWGAWGKA